MSAICVTIPAVPGHTQGCFLGGSLRFALGHALKDGLRCGYGRLGQLDDSVTPPFGQLFGRPESEARMFAQRAARVRDIGVSTAMYAMVLFAGMTLLASLAMAVAYGLGGWLVIRGTFQLGALVALTALLGRLYGPVTVLSNVQADVMTALATAPCPPRARQRLRHQPGTMTS